MRNRGSTWGHGGAHEWMGRRAAAKKRIGLFRPRVSYSRRLWNCAGSRLFRRLVLGTSASFGDSPHYLLAGEDAFDCRSACGGAQVDSSDEQIQALQERREDFEQKIRAGQPAEIELTADDINCLIAMRRAARWKAFVSMEENRLRLQMSVPLGEFFGWSRYYFNGDITIQTNGAVSLEPRKLSGQLNTVLVNNEPVPKNLELEIVPTVAGITSLSIGKYDARSARRKIDSTIAPTPLIGRLLRKGIRFHDAAGFLCLMEPLNCARAMQALKDAAHEYIHPLHPGSISICNRRPIRSSSRRARYRGRRIRVAHWQRSNFRSQLE